MRFTASEVATALGGWPTQRWEKAGFPVVFVRPVDAPHPGPTFVRIRPIEAMGLDPHHPETFIERQDPLAHTAEILEP